MGQCTRVHQNLDVSSIPNEKLIQKMFFGMDYLQMDALLGHEIETEAKPLWITFSEI